MICAGIARKTCPQFYLDILSFFFPLRCIYFIDLFILKCLHTALVQSLQSPQEGISSPGAGDSHARSPDWVLCKGNKRSELLNHLISF